MEVAKSAARILKSAPEGSGRMETRAQQKESSKKVSKISVCFVT